MTCTAHLIIQNLQGCSLCFILCHKMKQDLAHMVQFIYFCVNRHDSMSIFIFKNFGILITCSIVMSSGFYFMLYQSMSIKLLIILLTLVGIACSYQTLIIYLACTFVPSNISGIYLPWLFLQIIASGVYVAKKAWSLNKKLIDDKANIVFFSSQSDDSALIYDN